MFRKHPDVVLALLLMLFAASASFVGSGSMDPVVNSRETFDRWFDADAPRVFDNMVSRHSNYTRSYVHPLFGLVAYPPVFVLQRLVGRDKWLAVRLVIAGVAGLWMAALFALMRRIGLRRWDACLFALLGGSSAAAMFWFVVPETISFGSVTILLALLLAAEACRHPIARAWTVAVGVLTLGVTLTNWMAGLFATLAIHKRMDALKIIVVTIFTVSVLSSVSVSVFPRAALFGVTSRTVTGELPFLLHPDAGGVKQTAQSFLVHSVVMPEIQVVDPHLSWLRWKQLRVQLSSIGSGSAVGIAAAIVWTALLILGAWGVWKVKGLDPFRIVLVGTLLGQFGLHVLFGREVFLYSLHFTPLLLTVAAFGALTPWRGVSMALAAVLLPLTAINNGVQFRRAMHLFQVDHPPSARLAETIDLTPIKGVLNPGDGFSLALGGEGSQSAGSVGPGGSFSPADHSFGAAIWALDGDEIVLDTDTFLQPNMSQTIRQNYGAGSYSIVTDGHYYTTRLTMGKGPKWCQRIRQTDNFMTRLAVVIRSSGPSGAPIHSLLWRDGRLLINDRWSLVVSPLPIAVHVGEEVSPGRLVKRGQEWQSERGLGYAILELSREPPEWSEEITDLADTAHRSARCGR